MSRGLYAINSLCFADIGLLAAVGGESLCIERFFEVCSW